MNGQSIENLLVAEHARIETFSPTHYAVSVWRGGCCAFLHDSNGLMLFPNYFAAFVAVFKVRSNIPFNQSSRTISLQ